MRTDETFNKGLSPSCHPSRSDSVVTGVSSESQSAPLPLDITKKYENGFDLKDPIDLLFTFDDDITSGNVKLHKWQIQCMIDFAHPENCKDHPYIAEIAAANGSGKDKYIVAACAVWLCMKYRMALCAITNGSGSQLDGQTAFHIENLCRKVNAKIGYPVWKINYRYFECLPTNSRMELFATDEAGKAEGYHPTESGSKFAIFASEAKSIPDEIFAALTRCNGFTHRVDVSSPGQMFGYFYTQWSQGIDRHTFKSIKECPPTERVRLRITAYDCPHITANEIELFAQGLIAQGGKNSPVFKSGVDCEFGMMDEMTVLSYTQIFNCKAKPPEHITEQYNQAGLDLNSGGGAESVLKVRNGNKIIATEAFKFQDTEDNLDYCEELFYKWNLDNDQSLIWADCCGAGYPQLCALKKRGWTNIRFFDSRHESTRKKVYRNIVTEMWFNFAECVQKKQVIFDGDKLTETQLVTRYYKIDTFLKHQLLSKLEQKNKGYPSPDRADATIYCFIGYKHPAPSTNSPESHNERRRPNLQVVQQQKPVGHFDTRMLKQGDSRPQDRLPKKPNFGYLQEQLDEINKQRNQERNIEHVSST